MKILNRDIQTSYTLWGCIWHTFMRNKGFYCYFLKKIHYTKHLKSFKFHFSFFESVNYIQNYISRVRRFNIWIQICSNSKQQASWVKIICVQNFIGIANLEPVFRLFSNIAKKTMTWNFFHHYGWTQFYLYASTTKTLPIFRISATFDSFYRINLWKWYY